MLPSVIESLRAHGKSDSMKQFLSLVSAGTFPMENITYALFNNLVTSLSVGSSNQMRYRQLLKRKFYCFSFIETFESVFIILVSKEI